MLLENGVVLITSKFRDKVNANKANHYESCIPKETPDNIIFNGNTDKTGCYICYTCKTAIISGKTPSMAVTNGLQLAPIDESFQLTELENNLITQNINFQYIFCLPNSRWAATKKQMISVPVTPETVLNTVRQLPRIPREAGLIPVQLKRKKEYQGYHRKELIDANKVLRILDYLKKCGHPDYQFYDSLEEYEKRCKEQDKNGHELIFGNPEEDGACSSNQTNNEATDSDDPEEERDYNYITNDPVRKHQFA